MGNDDLDDETSEDLIQRALNEAKKKEIEEKFGATFGEGNSKAPPEIERQWLDNIEEFELQHENAKTVTVRAYIGNPTFKTLEEISPEKLSDELDWVLEYFEAHGIGIDFICDVPADLAYKFATEELMEHEIEDVHMAGWMTRFIYEEFHPNDEHDAKESGSHFFWHLFERDEEFIMSDFSKDEILDCSGNKITESQMKELIRAFWSKYAAFTSHKFEPTNCSLKDEYATVTFHGTWTGLKSGSMEPATFEGESILRMKKSPFGGYDLVQAKVVGWE